jgi:hypothetical protein
MASERLEEVLELLKKSALLSEDVSILALGSGCSVSVAESLLKEVGVDAAEAHRLRLRAAIDPLRLAYSFFGASRGVFNTFNWAAEKWRKNLRGMMLFPYEMCCRGRIPGVNAGDPWQQGAVLVLTTRRTASYEELYALREHAPGSPALDHAAFAAAVRSGVAALRDRAASAAAAEKPAPAALQARRRGQSPNLKTKLR